VRFAISTAIVIKIIVCRNVTLCTTRIVDTCTRLHCVTSHKIVMKLHELLNYLLVEEVSRFYLCIIHLDEQGINCNVNVICVS
jgi:hypothetical protein